MENGSCAANAPVPTVTPDRLRKARRSIVPMLCAEAHRATLRIRPDPPTDDAAEAAFRVSNMAYLLDSLYPSRLVVTAHVVGLLIAAAAGWFIGSHLCGLLGCRFHQRNRGCTGTREPKGNQEIAPCLARWFCVHHLSSCAKHFSIKLAGLAFLLDVERLRFQLQEGAHELAHRPIKVRPLVSFDGI